MEHTPTTKCLCIEWQRTERAVALFADVFVVAANDDNHHSIYWSHNEYIFHVWTVLGIDVSRTVAFTRLHFSDIYTAY